MNKDLVLTGAGGGAVAKLPEVQRALLDLVWGDDSQNRLDMDRAFKRAGCTREDFIKWCSDPVFREAWLTRLFAFLMLSQPKIINKLDIKARSGDLPSVRLLFDRLDRTSTHLFDDGGGSGNSRPSIDTYVFNAFGADTHNKLIKDAMKVIKTNRKDRGGR